MHYQLINIILNTLIYEKFSSSETKIDKDPNEIQINTNNNTTNKNSSDDETLAQDRKFEKFIEYVILFYF